MSNELSRGYLYLFPSDCNKIDEIRETYVTGVVRAPTGVDTEGDPFQRVQYMLPSGAIHPQAEVLSPSNDVRHGEIWFQTQEGRLFTTGHHNGYYVFVRNPRIDRRHRYEEINSSMKNARLAMLLEVAKLQERPLPPPLLAPAADQNSAFAGYIYVFTESDDPHSVGSVRKNRVYRVIQAPPEVTLPADEAWMSEDGTPHRLAVALAPSDQLVTPTAWAYARSSTYNGRAWDFVYMLKDPFVFAPAPLTDLGLEWYCNQLNSKKLEGS